MEDGIQECDFLLLSKEMCQLEYLHNQGNQCFLISLCVTHLEQHGGSSSLSREWTKGFYVTEDRFTDLSRGGFYVTEDRFTDLSRVSVASKKLHDYLERLFPFSLFFFSSHYSVRPSFLHRLQPKQHIATD